MATPALAIDRCTLCAAPTHASESDDQGRCVSCMRALGIELVLPTDEDAPEQCDHCGEEPHSGPCRDDDASPYDTFGLRGVLEAY